MRRTELQRARIDLLRGQIASAAGPITEASVQLLKAARRLEPLDVSLARETYLDAWAAAMYTGQLGGSGQLREVSDAARAAPASSGPPCLSDLLLDGFSLVVSEGLAAAAPTLRKAVARLPVKSSPLKKGSSGGSWRRPPRPRFGISRACGDSRVVRRNSPGGRRTRAVGVHSRRRGFHHGLAR